jgi:hypothetical protein
LHGVEWEHPDFGSHFDRMEMLSTWSGVTIRWP